MILSNDTAKKCRQVNGILLLDKPLHMTSNAALQAVKRLYAAMKAGHTGSLDPLASGMLPLCFGEATKFSQYVLEADKSYWVEAQLGVKTTTGDAEGEIIARQTTSKINEQQLLTTLMQFQGRIQQIPSMFSALKHKGRPLYELARQGKVVERPARQVTIYQLELLEFSSDRIKLRVVCSKGTYIRTLVEDIGDRLGCGAYVTALRRLSVGRYPENNMISLPELERVAQQADPDQLDTLLLPVTSMLEHLPKLQVSASTSFYLRRGQSVMVPNIPSQGLIRLHLMQGQFFGVGEALADGHVVPRRLIGTDFVIR